MNMLRITITPRSAFGSKIRGDTLFGQVCWAIRNRHGNDRLGTLIEGYLERRPFAVCSDAFPHGYLPRPSFPVYRFEQVVGAELKEIKKRRWLPLESLSVPVKEWLRDCRTDTEILPNSDDGEKEVMWSREHLQPHNSIDRLSGTTRSGEFAPYSMRQTWYAPGAKLDVYVVYDPDRLEESQVLEALTDIGRAGYGRDASIGLGKFDIENCEQASFLAVQPFNAWITLAPCAPQGLGWNPDRSFYNVFTRFGRHGDAAVYAPGGPFKTPVLLADTGALVTAEGGQDELFAGQGLGGGGLLSKTLPETVQQGYAPVAKVKLEWSVQ